MTKPLLLCVLAAAVALSSGCSLFSRKSRTKESSAIAAETEESLHKRYVEKRITELTAQGKTPEAARTMAEDEFRERYAFVQPHKK